MWLMKAGAVLEIKAGALLQTSKLMIARIDKSLLGSLSMCETDGPVPHGLYHTFFPVVLKFHSCLIPCWRIQYILDVFFFLDVLGLQNLFLDNNLQQPLPVYDKHDLMWDVYQSNFMLKSSFEWNSANNEQPSKSLSWVCLHRYELTCNPEMYFASR